MKLLNTLARSYPMLCPEFVVCLMKVCSELKLEERKCIKVTVLLANICRELLLWENFHPATDYTFSVTDVSTTCDISMILMSHWQWKLQEFQQIFTLSQDLCPEYEKIDTQILPFLLIFHTNYGSQRGLSTYKPFKKCSRKSDVFRTRPWRSGI